jgi:peptidoglycan/LPS O-acetylase OafA/YrhL
LLGDFERDAWSFKAFYARRAKRLTPALLATFAFSLLPVPGRHIPPSKNILAVSTMTSNVFLSRQTGYFDAKAADQRLRHTWSLSAEEQFYVVLPLLLFWLYRSKRNRTTLAFVLLTIASCIAAVVATHHESNGAYYFTQYRAFEFLAETLNDLYFPVHRQACQFDENIASVAGSTLLYSRHEKRHPGELAELLSK